MDLPDELKKGAVFFGTMVEEGGQLDEDQISLDLETSQDAVNSAFETLEGSGSYGSKVYIIKLQVIEVASINHTVEFDGGSKPRTKEE